MSGTVTRSDVLVEGMKGLELARGLGREVVKKEMLVSGASSEVEGMGLSSVCCDFAPLCVVGLLAAKGSNLISGGDWISTDQALATVSISKPSRRMRILPQESQLGGMDKNLVAVYDVVLDDFSF